MQTLVGSHNSEQKLEMVLESPSVLSDLVNGWLVTGVVSGGLNVLYGLLNILHHLILAMAFALDF